MIKVWLIDDVDYFIKIHNYFDDINYIFTKNYNKLLNIINILKSNYNNLQNIFLYEYINLQNIFEIIKSVKYFLLIPEYFVCKNIKVLHDIQYDLSNDIINCVYETFPHGTIEFTYNRNDWWKIFEMVKTNKLIYDNIVFSFCPQLFNVDISIYILNNFLQTECLLKDFYIIYSLYSLNLNHVNSIKLYNNNLSMNVYNHNIPLQYKKYNCINGLNNNSAFMYIHNDDNVFENFYINNYNNIVKNPPINLLKLLMNELIIYTTHLNLIRLGGNNDGSYILCDISSDVIYGYGVGNTYTFENEFINKYNSKICILYDHTVDTNNLPKNIIHKKIGCDFYDNEITSTIVTHINNNIIENLHHNTNNMLLKMDIEGYEWLSLLYLPDDILIKFNQIIIELHWLDSNRNASILQKINVLQKLNKYFYCVHVHGVNCRTTLNINNFLLHPVLEATFIRKDLSINSIINNNIKLPITLDKPNDGCLNDIILSNLYPWKKLTN